MRLLMTAAFFLFSASTAIAGDGRYITTVLDADEFIVTDTKDGYFKLCTRNVYFTKDGFTCGSWIQLH